MIRRSRRVDQRAAPLFALGLLLALLAGCGGAAADEPPPPPTLTAQLAAGQRVFVAHCGACHSAAAETVIVGPSLAGVAARGGERVDGLDARAYVYSSVLQPSDYVVSGFDDLMPQDLAKKLTGEELDAVVAYVLSLE
ncbi:MAG: cytochrome c [Candidatus Promineofilum sp.]|nr:cytochrome c [Promineifilum sp.]